MSQKPSLIIISGPTCVGKTDVAIALAEPLGAEIISADAMQVYRYMNIGTAKPTEEQRSRVCHHLIDVVNPDEPFSAVLFRTMADAVIRDLDQKGRPIFVAGGTGLYIKALTRGLFAAQEQNGIVRKRLKDEAETLGIEALYQRLQKVDPVVAARIHPNDTYRIIRALEVHKVTGQPISHHQRVHGFRDFRYRTLKIGLTTDRNILYDRINSRHMSDHLEGRTPWDEAVHLFKRDTRRYAKRQLTWFGADPEIQWVQPGEIDVMSRKIDSFLTEGV